MNFKTTLTIGVAIIIGAIILRQDESTDMPNLEIMEYNDSYSEGPIAEDKHIQTINYTSQVENGNNAAMYSNGGYEENEKNYGKPKSNHMHDTYQSESNEGIKMAPLMDPQRGIPFGHYPIPTSWTVKEDGWYGPNKMIIKFITSPYSDLGQKRYQSPNQMLTQGEIGKLIRQNNGRVSDIKTLHAIAQCDRNYSQAIQLDNQRWDNEAIGFAIEADGIKSYGVLKTSRFSSQMGGGWNFTLISIDANPEYIDQAYQHLVYAQSNYKPNRQQIAMYKSDHYKKMNQLASSYNSSRSRMKNNQKHFEARNRAIVGAGNATNDAIMSSSRYSNESFDRMYNKTTNGIYSENTVTNPYDGTTHQASDMYDRTFMNAFGEQIQTNDQFYQPGMDPNAIGYQEVYPNGGY